MDFMTFIDIVLIAGLVVLVLSIPFLLKHQTELEEKGFEVKRFLIQTVIIIVWLVLLLFVLGG
jgi:uncharacterized membrane-anchored protein